MIFAPFRELIHRRGLQGSPAHFLAGPRRDALAIVGANIICPAAHLSVSISLAVTAFAAGPFRGRPHVRRRGPAGVAVSQVPPGLRAFEVANCGVPE